MSGSDVGIVLAGAAGHPDAAVRNAIGEVLDEWTASLGPRWTPQDMMDHLQGCAGTVLEPFRLSAKGARMVAYAGTAALSKHAAQTRFRVVSDDTLDGDGGLVLTNNLRSYYVERFAFGYRRRTPRNRWFIIPKRLTGTAKAGVRRPEQAHVTLHDSGFILTVPIPPIVSHLGADVQTATVIVDHHGKPKHGDRSPLTSLTPQVTPGPAGTVTIHSHRPEDLLRFSAILERRPRMRIVLRGTENAVGTLNLQLVPDLLDGARVPVICTGIESLWDTTVSMHLSVGSHMPRVTKIALGWWMGLPSPWVTDDLLEEML
jgi:hypothetical protein